MTGASKLALAAIAAVAGALAFFGAAMAQSGRAWWSPGEGQIFPASIDYPNALGVQRVLLAGGPLATKDHAFFTAKSANGRACVTCHQPADGMSLSAASAQEQWERTGPSNPLFAAIDGSNCPSLPQAARASHSLLLEYGLIRIARPWPPRDQTGKPIKPDFKIEVVRDPSTCNLDPQWGLASKTPHVSVFRRPRPVANFKYITAMGFSYDPKSGMALPLDPETGKAVSGNLMSDRRALSLAAQMRDASSTHLQMIAAMTPAEIRQIQDFEERVYVAQESDHVGGALDADGAQGGPRKLAESQPGRLGSQGTAVWSEFEAWEKAPEADKARLPAAVRAYRDSVARGAHVFREKTFLITDSAGINSPVGFGNPVRNSCVFCHNMSQMGMDVAPGQVDLGTTNLPFADPAPHLPLFRITCLGQPHAHLGKVFYTSDPGYALTTGRCADVGKITLQTLRGMASRAPYFSNGSAKDLRGVIDFYDRRYNIGYTEQEKQDLVNLMGAL